MSKNGIIVNEWENLTALSNRRLNVQNLNTPLKLQWSIDRITIVGKLKENIYYHTPNDVLILNFEQLMQLNEGNGFVKSVGLNGWQIVDKHDENIAYIEILKYQEGQGRIDFNPNKINQFLASSMKNFIHDLFLEPHFSRADIACDIIDVPDDFITQYRVVDPVSFKPIYGRSGKLETAYWGSRASERQIRMYNKKLEQERKRKIVPKEIETWWRLELQLRRGKATDWHEMVQESLNSFASLHFLPIDTTPTDRIMLAGLMSDQNFWSLLSRNSKYKYRELLKEESQNDELTNHLRETFAESADNLKQELDTWLLGLDVTEK
ncbi:TPA: replication initiation factor domain-containing protein [Enterococcus faecium]|uniref:replication initiation factor domain-containing protein n=1 Tax=Enterococcus faecium TaxID=1352 RepID=UPI00115BD293|nr:replication initiation factor domain-containing protein [Enterococcus faecium]MCU2045669.1 replication initiation factor domain-containing protein [Enterococcus faecium]HAQ4405432.1 replication initiation factor domain-containing protein [Enterococcus faecium]HAQ4441806.1 replication initiation factor domain-containing protein [Enterococcus faecium]HAQ4455928.1 replication initiation factor domain-containing protein [Enterococcus faecium]HAQ4461386.1 replication initiation factor domain-con